MEIALNDDELPAFSASPTPPPVSPLTPDEKYANSVANLCMYNIAHFYSNRLVEGNIKLLLLSHTSKVLTDDSDKIQRLTICRNYIFADTLSILRRPGFHFNWNVHITFVGEPAVDACGPCREFFRLIIHEIISNNRLFQGPMHARFPCHNMQELEKGTYKHIGQIISLSLVHDGPGPHCLAPWVVDYILYRLGGVFPIPEQIPNDAIQTTVRKVTMRAYAPDYFAHKHLFIVNSVTGNQESN